MPDDELYVGPSLLEPGARDPLDGAGHRLASRLLVPIAVLAFVVLMFYVFFHFSRVDGPSMLPTLRTNDRMLVTKGYPTPRRGDVIVTKVIENGQPVDLVKRVIALPGDTVEIRQDAAIVNGQPEPARGQIIFLPVAVSAAAITVPPGMLYVMGDNRPDSTDSRFIGSVPLRGVLGRAVAIYTPVNRIRMIH